MLASSILEKWGTLPSTGVPSCGQTCSILINKQSKTSNVLIKTVKEFTLL
jgi:hypothetical protein